MALTDHKIPILTGINDVPSTDGQPNHPNDSLLCDKYNALIDNIPTEVEGIARSAISVTGSGGSYDLQTGIITLASSIPSEFDFNGDSRSYADLIYDLLLTHKITIYCDLSGNILSNTDYPNPVGLTAIEFNYDGTSYPVNQWHTFWFGQINVGTGSPNISFQLDTVAVTSDLLIPIIVYLADNNGNTYPFNVEIIVSSVLVDSISADPANSGGSGSGGSGSI